VLVATPTLESELNARGIRQTRRWSRGIDGWLFRPDGEHHPDLAGLPRPILLNVGRVAPEKNLEAFLDAGVPGTKVVVGGGPSLAAMRARYPDVVFMGTLSGEELAAAYRSADCFVFPSLTDTFGLVVIEALACGVPVAAFPVCGPIDIVGRKGKGASGHLPRAIAAIDDDLPRAIGRALTVDRQDASRYGAEFTWERATDQFLSALTSVVPAKAGPADPGPPARRAPHPA
jgi:glycosyltransferase involved in cell wall biosynthesis